MNKGILAVVAVLALALTAVGGERFIGYRSFDRQPTEAGVFAQLGVKVQAFGVCNTFSGRGRPYSEYPAVWLGEGQYDWASLDRQMSDLIAASPEAKFIALIDLNTPPWLQRKLHLDSFDAISSAACSDGWHAAAKEWLVAAIGYLEAHYGERMVGYALMAGQTTEWFEVVVGRTGPEKNAAWREWCARRGFDGGEVVPSEAEFTRAAFENVLYDPASERRKIEYWRFHNGMIASALIEMAQAAKSAAPKKEIGSFFGYYNICNRNLASVGHLAYEEAMAAPCLDFVLSPATYTEREIGHSTLTMTVPGTLRRHGKRFFHEIDFWPHDRKVWFAGEPYWHSPAETIAGNTREAAYAIVNGASFWWFDQKGGFYSTTPGMHERIARLTEIAERFKGDGDDLLADVMFVADPDSAYGMVDMWTMDAAGKRAVTPDGLVPSLGAGEALALRMGDAGATVDVCSFSDLDQLDLSRIKAFVLPASWTITPEKLAILKRRVFRPGKTAIWTYAPGVSDGERLDAARVKEFAGVEFKTPGIATTAMPGGWRAVYAYDWREFTQERLRETLKEAGCHFWTDEMLPVMASSRLFAIHCLKGGAKRIALPFRCEKVIDLISGETVATDAESFEARLNSPDTRLYEMIRTK